LSKRALVIGSDRDYCYVIKEFLELRELYTTVVLNYKDGLDRLFYEKPDLAVLELINQELTPALLSSLKSSNDFETVDFAAGAAPAEGRKSVLIFDDKNRITSLFDFIKKNYSGKPAAREANTENEGNLRSTFFPCLLAEIYEKRQTGVLSIKSTSNLEIYFTKGVPTFAEGGDVETAIGRILLDKGKIDRESYEKAIDISSSTNQKFGEVLFGMGITSPHELNVYLELQIEEKILRGFYYLQGSYEFRGGSNSPRDAVSYHLNLPRLVYEGIKRYVDVEDLEDRNPVVEVKPKLKTEVNNLWLKPKELRFVQLLKPRSYLKEILEGSRLEKGETLKLLYFLSLFRLVGIPGLAVDRVGRASVEKRLAEMEAERAETGYAADITAEEEASDAAPVAEEAPEPSREAGLEPEEAEPEEKVWEIEAEEEAGDGGEAEDEFSLTLEESPDLSNEISFSTGEAHEGLSLDAGSGNGDTGEVKKEARLSGIEDLLLDKPAFSETPEAEAGGAWKPFQNDESPMPWEMKEDEEISIDPISPGEPISRELEATEAEAGNGFSFRSSSEEESEIDFSSLYENAGGEAVGSWEAGRKEEETERIEEAGEKEEKVWEIDLDSFNKEGDGAGQETGTEETGNSGTFYIETEESETSAGQPWEVETTQPGEPVGASAQNPFQSSVEHENEPELVLDFDRDAARDELEEEEEPADLPLEHNWGLPDKGAVDVFTERVNGFYEDMEKKDHYQILGIQKGASGEEIRDSYYKLVKNYHPDVNPNADNDTRLKAEEIFTRITSAYETLSQTDKRQEYDSHEELAELKSQAKYIYEAEIAFKKGITLLIQRDYVEAEKKIREAIIMNPEEAAYIGAHGWTKYLATDNKSEVFGESVKALEKAIKINGKIPENHYYLGCVYKNHNELKNAEKSFQKAIELEPDYIEAKRELRLINARKTSARTEKKPEKKFWSSLFKR